MISFCIFTYTSISLDETKNQVHNLILNQNNGDDDGEDELSLLELQNKIKSNARIGLLSMISFFGFRHLYYKY